LLLPLATWFFFHPVKPSVASPRGIPFLPAPLLFYLKIFFPFFSPPRALLSNARCLAILGGLFLRWVLPALHHRFLPHLHTPFFTRKVFFIVSLFISILRRYYLFPIRISVPLRDLISLPLPPFFYVEKPFPTLVPCFPHASGSEPVLTPLSLRSRPGLPFEPQRPLPQSPTFRSLVWFFKMPPDPHPPTGRPFLTV